MTNNPPEAFAAALSVALRILSTRALAFLALFMSFGLMGWAMWAQTWIAFTSATTFAVLAYLPALWSTRGSS
jgi:hypothetical protein